MASARGSSSERFIRVPGESRPTPTKRVGVYEVLADIGSGTSAQVVLARTPKGDLVAVKVLKREESSHPQARERFAREALITSRIEHPGIVRALDAGEDHGLPYIVMEYVAGASLRERLASGALAVPEALRIIAAVARAMHAAHGAGVIHRDMKPANILLDRAGKPRVSDFGLARDQYARRDLTRDGDLIGTPYYMAPEQVRAEAVTPATDVWGLGVVLYECLTGARPFEGTTVPQVSQLILHETPMKPSRAAKQLLPQALDIVCAAALTKDPTRRPSMEALARDLESIAIAGAEPQRPHGGPARPLLLAVAAAAGVALGALLGLGLAPKPAPFDARPLERERDAVAATASSLKLGLEKAAKEKAELEQRVAGLEAAAATKRGLDAKELLRLLGVERLAAGRELGLAVDRALRDLEGVPASPAQIALRARLLSHRGRVREVVALIRANPCDEPDAQRLFGEALVALREEEGRNVLRRLVERDPEGARAQYVKARSTQIRTAEDVERAVALLDRALQLDPDFGDAAAEKGLLLAQLVLGDGRSYEPAMAAANKAVAIDPTAPRAWFGRSFVSWNALCFRTGRGESAPDELVSACNSDLRAAFGLNGDWEYLVYCGKTYVVAGRPLEGLAELDYVVAQTQRGDPMRTFALAWRGNAHMAAGDEAAAVDDWLAAFATGPREIAHQCAGYAEKVKDEERRHQLQNAGLELARPRDSR